MSRRPRRHLTQRFWDLAFMATCIVTIVMLWKGVIS